MAIQFMRMGILTAILVSLLTACYEAPRRLIVPRTPVVNPVIAKAVPCENPICVPNPYSRCTIVPGHFEGMKWIHAYPVCYYRHLPKNLIWIRAHWRCTKYLDFTIPRTCLNWQWQRAHVCTPYVLY